MNQEWKVRPGGFEEFDDRKEASLSLAQLSRRGRTFSLILNLSVLLSTIATPITGAPRGLLYPKPINHHNRVSREKKITPRANSILGFLFVCVVWKVCFFLVF